MCHVLHYRKLLNLLRRILGLLTYLCTHLLMDQRYNYSTLFLVVSLYIEVLKANQLCFRSANYCRRRLEKDILLPCLHLVTLISLYSSTFSLSWTQVSSLTMRDGIWILHPSVYCTHLPVSVVGGSSLSLTYIASERIIPGCVPYSLETRNFLF